jgi:hypothetical protein
MRDDMDRDAIEGEGLQVPDEPEDRDSVAPEPERRDPADAGGDSPGPTIGVPDRPAVSDGTAATTVEELREPSLERRIAMERPDVSDEGEAVEAAPDPRPIVDDDVAVQDLDADRSGFDAAEVDLDRERAEVGEENADDVSDGPEEAAMHIEEE